MATMNFRCTDKQKNDIESKAEQYGFNSVGAYIKFACINANISVEVTQELKVNTPEKLKNNTEIDKKIKIYKKAYIENYVNFTSQTNTALLNAKEILCEMKPNKKDVFVIMNKMSNISGSNKSKKAALKNEEKYVFELIELFRD